MFDILDYLPCGMNNLQDLVMLQKPFTPQAVLEPQLPSREREYRLEQRLCDFEDIIKRKDQHIVYLEQHIRQIEAGKIMRLLNAMRKAGRRN
jgi:hypothetical protein